MAYTDILIRCLGSIRNNSKVHVNNVPSENFFSKSLKVSLIGDIVEIPCFKQGESIDNFNTTEDREINIPLFLSNPFRENTRASSNPVYSDFFKDETVGLRKVKCKDVYYIGGKGIIFYEDLTPMMMLSTVLKKERNEYKVDHQNLRLNPIIFLKDDIIAKNLRGKFIQEFLSLGNEPYSRYTHQYFNFNLEESLYKPKIIIDSLDSFFDVASTPTVNTTNEAINDFLAANVDNIL